MTSDRGQTIFLEIENVDKKFGAKIRVLGLSCFVRVWRQVSEEGQRKGDQGFQVHSWQNSPGKF
jgi:hypothetical protein